MKKLKLAVATALTLCSGAMNVQAHGHCGWGGGGCWGGCGWPLWSFGIGFGIGTAVGVAAASPPRYAVYSYPYAYPVQGYSYAPVVTAGTVPAVNYARQPSSSLVTATAPHEIVWVPHTPGAGKWVPDPNPYSYTPPESAVASSTRPARTEAPVDTAAVARNDSPQKQSPQ